ncbi:MAG TPA: hypothetical protein VF062_12825 [Candidatus Limnocylindrales bacterium]
MLRLLRSGVVRSGSGVALALLAAGFAVSAADIWSYDAWIMAQVTHSMVYDGNFLVHEDPFNLSMPYSSYGIGMSLLMVVPELLGPLLNRSVNNLNALINPVVAAATGVVVWRLARALGVTTRRAAAIALIMVLATPMLPYAASTFSEPATAFGVALGLLGLELVRRRELLGALLAGIGVGIAVLVRVDSALLIAPVLAIGVFVAARRRIAATLVFGAGALPAFAIVAWYNIVRYGTPLVSQYQGMSPSRAFGHPFLSGLYGLTLSPARGLLVFAPLALVAVVGARWLWRRSRVMTIVCLVLIVDRLLFYASWYSWHAGTGWGPRFLVPALPALAPFLVEVVRRLPDARTTARLAFAALVGVSFAVQVVGATTSPGQDKLMAAIAVNEKSVPLRESLMAKFTSAEQMEAWDRALMDWSVSPVLDHARQLVRGENLAGRFLSPQPRPLPLILQGVLLVAGLLLAFVRARKAEENAAPHRTDVPEEASAAAG